jgi:hypothetical protein
MRICVFLFVPVCVCVCVVAFVCVNVFPCVWVWVWVCLCVSVCLRCVYVPAYICVYVHCLVCLRAILHLLLAGEVQAAMAAVVGGSKDAKQFVLYSGAPRRALAGESRPARTRSHTLTHAVALPPQATTRAR